MLKSVQGYFCINLLIYLILIILLFTADERKTSWQRARQKEDIETWTH
jgi:hypothetical protein